MTGTQHLSWDLPGLGLVPMVAGYVLALIVAGFFAVECHLGVKKDRSIAQLERTVEKRDERIDELAAELEFLARQNQALFARCAPRPVPGPRRHRRARRRTRST